MNCEKGDKNWGIYYNCFRILYFNKTPACAHAKCRRFGRNCARFFFELVLILDEMSEIPSNRTRFFWNSCSSSLRLPPLNSVLSEAKRLIPLCFFGSGNPKIFSQFPLKNKFGLDWAVHVISPNWQ